MLCAGEGEKSFQAEVKKSPPQNHETQTNSEPRGHWRGPALKDLMNFDVGRQENPRVYSPCQVWICPSFLPTKTLGPPGA